MSDVVMSDILKGSGPFKPMIQRLKEDDKLKRCLQKSHARSDGSVPQRGSVWVSEKTQDSFNTRPTRYRVVVLMTPLPVSRLLQAPLKHVGHRDTVVIVSRQRKLKWGISSREKTNDRIKPQSTNEELVVICS
jgi:hypothetical protein